MFVARVGSSSDEEQRIAEKRALEIMLESVLQCLPLQKESIVDL
jgi:hypothetical protein